MARSGSAPVPRLQSINPGARYRRGSEEITWPPSANASGFLSRCQEGALDRRLHRSDRHPAAQNILQQESGRCLVGHRPARNPVRHPHAREHQSNHADATERWIVHCQAEGLEHGTIIQRRQHLKLHIAPFLGSELLANLTAPRVHQFIGDLRDAGRSLSMRRKVLSNLKTILSYAQGQGLVAQNVAREIKLKTDPRDTAEPLREGHNYPNRTELRILIDKAPPRWRPFIFTAVFTGMRASELRGLSWDYVDLDRGMIHVRQRADNWRNLGAPKSAAGKRDIPITPLVLNTLRTWRAACPPGELGLVFPNGAGRIESHANLRNRFFTRCRSRPE